MKLDLYFMFTNHRMGGLMWVGKYFSFLFFDLLLDLEFLSPPRSLVGELMGLFL